MSARFPQRIVCMTEETTEVLYLLGEQDRIVGISGYTVRPPRARKEKPKVSAFTSAKIEFNVDADPFVGFTQLSQNWDYQNNAGKPTRAITLTNRHVNRIETERMAALFVGLNGLRTQPAPALSVTGGLIRSNSGVEIHREAAGRDAV